MTDLPNSRPSLSTRFGARSLVVCCTLLFVLATQPGCGFTSWLKNRHKPVPDRVLQQNASLDDIMEHVNNDRARLVGWQSTDVRISAHGAGILTPSLSANLSVESPRNLRMRASSPRGPEVDFGSNPDRFWFWTRAAEPKYILTGSHESLENLPDSPLPFPPSWLMEALGVIPISPNGIELQRDTGNPDRVRLVSQVELQGQSMQRVMIVDLRLGQIVEHALYDDREQLVTSATLDDFRAHPAGVVLPHRIDLNWPQQKTELTMKIGTVQVNPEMSSAVWQVPSYPKYRVVDLDHQVIR